MAELEWIVELVQAFGTPVAVVLLAIMWRKLEEVEERVEEVREEVAYIRGVIRAYGMNCGPSNGAENGQSNKIR